MFIFRLCYVNISDQSCCGVSFSFLLSMLDLLSAVHKISGNFSIIGGAPGIQYPGEGRIQGTIQGMNKKVLFVPEKLFSLKFLGPFEFSWKILEQ